MDDPVTVRSDWLSLVLAIAATLAMAAIAMEFLRRRRVERSRRSEQESPSGEPVENEWGKESFPASDPPQSW